MLILMSGKALPRERGCTAIACGPRRRTSIGPTTIEEVVGVYIRDIRPRAVAALTFYAGLPDVRAAVAYVASWRGPDGRIHPHQRRVPRQAKLAATALLREDPLPRVGDFAELLAWVCGRIGAVGGIGALTTYDVALRIGAHLGVLPDLVYLQRGSRRGARALGITGSRSIPVGELPPAFTLLDPWEIENCLCIYKRELERIGSTASPA